MSEEMVQQEQMGPKSHWSMGTAVGVMVPFRMPELNAIYPNGTGWVLTVLGIGAVVSLVAAFGYRMVARVANIAAPWMVLVFLAFGVVALGWFVSATGARMGTRCATASRTGAPR